MEKNYNSWIVLKYSQTYIQRLLNFFFADKEFFQFFAVKLGYFIINDFLFMIYVTNTQAYQ